MDVIWLWQATLKLCFVKESCTHELEMDTLDELCKVGRKRIFSTYFESFWKKVCSNCGMRDTKYETARLIVAVWFIFSSFFFYKQDASSAQLVEMSCEWKLSALCWAWDNGPTFQQTELMFLLWLLQLCSTWLSSVCVSSSQTEGRAHHLNMFSSAKLKGDFWEDSLCLLVTLKRSFCLFLVISGAFRNQLVQPLCSLRPLAFSIAHCVLPCLSFSGNDKTNDTWA